VRIAARYERDWGFDLFCPVQMKEEQDLKNTFPSQSRPIQSKKNTFLLVQQKLPSMTGPDQW
jgi:hypothetical protein